jgi:predicted lipoprotein
MLAYHFVEAAPVGPASDNGRVISDNIYSWPVLDLCGIDQEVLKLKETQGTNPKALYNVKGLAALEYLLFEPSLKARCNPRAYPKTLAWSQKSALEKKQDRCEYAKVLTEELVARAQELDNAWDVKKGNFSKTLMDGSRYKSLSDATNAVTDSLFSIEKLKDLKLGKPMGRHKECTNESGVCPENAEHPYSGLALRAAEAQMRGFQAVFFGSKNANSKDFGLDDFLATKGHPEVGAKIQEYLTLAIDSAKELALQGNLQDLIAKIDPVQCKATTIEDRKEPLCGLHAEIRGVSNTLTIDVLSILSLRTPPTHQGDND